VQTGCELTMADKKYIPHYVFLLSVLINSV